MDTCKWTENENGLWETDCNDSFEFYSSGPVENGMKFCPYCGKPLEEVKYVDPWVDDEEEEENK